MADSIYIRGQHVYEEKTILGGMYIYGAWICNAYVYRQRYAINIEITLKRDIKTKGN